MEALSLNGEDSHSYFELQLGREGAPATVAGLMAMLGWPVQGHPLAGIAYKLGDQAPSDLIQLLAIDGDDDLHFADGTLYILISEAALLAGDVSQVWTTFDYT